MPRRRPRDKPDLQRRTFCRKRTGGKLRSFGGQHEMRLRRAVEALAPVSVCLILGLLVLFSGCETPQVGMPTARTQDVTKADLIKALSIPQKAFEEADYELAPLLERISTDDLRRLEARCAPTAGKPGGQVTGGPASLKLGERFRFLHDRHG